jgi:hypothetical protein
MPEADGEKASAPQASRDADAPTAGEAPHVSRASWLYYGLGLSLQTVLWALLLLAIVVAVMVGGKLTEFRYVGF